MQTLTVPSAEFPNFASALQNVLDSGFTQDTEIVFVDYTRIQNSVIFPRLPKTGKTLYIKGNGLLSVGYTSSCTFIISGDSYKRGHFYIDNVSFGSTGSYSNSPFIYTEKNAHVCFRDCSFVKNKFQYAIYTLSPCTFEDCKFDDLSGAVFSSVKSEFTYCYFNNCGNEIDRTYVLINSGSVVNCTFNSSNYLIRIVGDEFFVNNLIWNSVNSQSIIVDVDDNVKCYFNDVDKLPGVGCLHNSGSCNFSYGNISVDPLFTIPPRVSNNSPVVNNGFDTYDFRKTRDYYGRSIIGTVDIGCVESYDEVCSLTCETSTENYCASSCEVWCQQSCEHICQMRCETSCEFGCQLWCQKGCEVSCTVSCENTTCETVCQISCEAVCQSSCQTSCTSLCQFSNCQLSCQLSTEP